MRGGYKRKNESLTLKTVLAAMGMFLLGLLGGNSMEPVAGTVLLAFLAYVIWKIRRKIRFHVWEITGFIGFIPGFAVLIFAPGNGARADVVSEITGGMSFFKDFSIRIVRETYYTFRYMSLLFGIAVALVVVAWFVKRKKDVSLKESGIAADNLDKRKKRSVVWISIKEIASGEKYGLLFILFAFISIYAMTLSIAFATRIFINPTVLLIISIGLSMKHIIINDKIKKIIRPAAGVLAAFMFVFVTAQYTTAMLEMHQSGEPFTKDIYYVNSEFGKGVIQE